MFPGPYTNRFSSPVPKGRDSKRRTAAGDKDLRMDPVSNFNQSINRHHHKKDHIEISHLTEFDVFGVSRNRVIDLET